jgi:hypothetical protein
MPDEAKGKFLYDMVAARLTAQAADQVALVGRAKDLLGVATITTTITGVLAKDKVANISKADLDPWLFGLMAIALATVVWLAFGALRPRTWYLSPEPTDVAATVSSQPTWAVDTYYASVAMGFISPGVVVSGKSALDHNRLQINELRQAVRLQMLGLSVLAGCGLALAYEAVL